MAGYNAVLDIGWGSFKVGSFFMMVLLSKLEMRMTFVYLEKLMINNKRFFESCS